MAEFSLQVNVKMREKDFFLDFPALQLLQESANLTDITFLCQDGRVQAHQIVLAKVARILDFFNEPEIESSSCLGCCYRNKSENHRLFLSLAETEVRDLQKVLELIYTGKTRVLPSRKKNFDDICLGLGIELNNVDILENEDTENQDPENRDPSQLEKRTLSSSRPRTASIFRTPLKEIFPCNLCPESFDQKSLWQDHVKTKHNNEVYNKMEETDDSCCMMNLNNINIENPITLLAEKEKEAKQNFSLERNPLDSSGDSKTKIMTENLIRNKRKSVENVQKSSPKMVLEKEIVDKKISLNNKNLLSTEENQSFIKKNVIAIRKDLVSSSATKTDDSYGKSRQNSNQEMNSEKTNLKKRQTSFDLEHCTGSSERKRKKVSVTSFESSFKVCLKCNDMIEKSVFEDHSKNCKSVIDFEEIALAFCNSSDEGEI